jgi:broad specificity phosphatase PhoE
MSESFEGPVTQCNNKRKKRILRRRGERLIVVMRHGFKEELDLRFDLPIKNKDEAFCEDFKTFCSIASGILNDPVIFTSPFTRTRQTAGRLATSINYKNPIVVVNDFSETWNQVVPQLKKCKDSSKYRAPSPPSSIDKCMAKLKKKELKIYTDARDELDFYDFIEDNTKFASSAKQVDLKFKRTLNDIIDEVPIENDIIVVTHGRHVRKSLDVLIPRVIPRLAFVPKTCGTAIFAEKNGGIRLIDANFNYF